MTPRVSPALVLLVAFLFVPRTAAPQTPQADGIRAFVSGDYGRAAQILGPLAEDPQKPDQVAQFLMALLYDTGRGVGRNGFRACGLFLRAAATPGPFTDQAVQLARLLRDESGPMADQMCRGDARWRTTPPMTLTLAPDHFIDISDSSVVVRYRGEERRVMGSGLPDSIQLPVIHTPLDVLRPQRARRHFLQTFIWWRDSSSSWALGWILSEVSGLEFVPVTGDRQLMSVTSPEPPSTVNLESLARVRVTEHGEVEWVISAGTNPRSAIIPPRGPK